MDLQLQSQILKRVDEISAGRKLCDRFIIAMEALLRASAGDFSVLEGLTREGGQIVFVSSDKRKIENTAPNAKPVKLPSGNWYVNAAGGKVEFEIIIDSSRKHLRLPVGFVEELKRITILRPDIVHE